MSYKLFLPKSFGLKEFGFLRYFFIPQWEKLMDITVWRKAAEQV